MTTHPAVKPANQKARRAQVLTQPAASRVPSIADAVVAKDGEPFFLCRPDGQVPLDGPHGYGLYHHDCRFLSGYELTLAGSHLASLAADELASDRMALELTNREIRLPDGSSVDEEQIALRWTRRIDATGPVLEDQLSFVDYGTRDLTLPVDLRFKAGFEDVFRIRGLLDEQPGTESPSGWHDDELVFSYAGRDGIDRSVHLTFDPAPARRPDDGAGFDLRVPARGTAQLHVLISIDERIRDDAPPIERREAPPESTDTTQREAATDRPHVTGGAVWTTKVSTSSLVLRAALTRSLTDLQTLRSRLGGRRYYEAGVPWFATLFGRDALISAYQTLAFDPSVAADTLRLLASRQGTKVDHWRDEAPGKILHELRIGELARLGEIPHSPYYGTVDATPLFLILLGRHAAWTGDLDLFRELRGSVDAALGWMDDFADSDGDGFLDYESDSPKRLVNQGWKDSGDAIVNAAGDVPEAPIALAEVQGYAYRAWLTTADLLERDGDAKAAGALRDRARELRDRFESRFWSEDLGCYILALAHGDPCEVVTSNAGQVLWGGIASDQRARQVADRLMRHDMSSGWGIRTLSTEAAAFRPIGYHLGTVWPHDNALIAEGFRAYGLDDAAETILVSLLEASQGFDHERLPECYAGYGRDEFSRPVRYPVACHPQAWAAGAIPQLLVATLGLIPEGLDGRLRIVRPRLPPSIAAVELRDLRVGGGSVDLGFERVDEQTHVQILRASGGVDVQVEPSSARGSAPAAVATAGARG